MKNLSKLVILIIVLVNFSLMAEAAIFSSKKQAGGTLGPNGEVTYKYVSHTQNWLVERIVCSGYGKMSCPDLESHTGQIIEGIIENNIINGLMSGIGTYGDATYSWEDGVVQDNGIIEYYYEIDNLPKNNE